MRVGITSSKFCLIEELDDLLEVYSWIREYDFIVNENYDYDYLGTIDISSLVEIPDLALKSLSPIIVFPAKDGNPIILEIYDDYRE